MAEDLINEVNIPTGGNKSLITIVGVGGAGGNAVNYMHSVGIEGVTFMVCNTDRQALDKSPVEVKIQLGLDGLGAGNDPERGRDAATSTLDDVRHQLESLGTQMIFIAAGMGGGTGTGASPVIAKLAHEMGILTVAIVTLPLETEGILRNEQAHKGVEELSEWVDSLLVLNNNKLGEVFGRMSLRQAFGKANEVLSNAAKGIAEIITVPSDLVNVDYADVRRVLENSGRAHMSVASATGDNRAEEAVEASLRSPLLDNHLIKGAKSVLVYISTNHPDALMEDEVRCILSCVQAHANTRRGSNEANIIWGTGIKPSLGDALEVVIVATGFDPSEQAAADEDIPALTPRVNVETKKEKPALSPEREHVIPSRRGSKYDNVGDALSTPAYKRRNMLQYDPSVRGTIRRDSARDTAAEVQPQNDNSLF